MENKKSGTSGTYEAGCHCGYVKFSVTLSPPLPEYKVLDCNCSMCRKSGYLLVYPHRKDVEWRSGARERCAVYRFNTKLKDQLFCPRCGTSLGIDFRDATKPRFDGYGISVRSFYGVSLDSLQYVKGHGLENVKPSGDLSGTQYELDEEEKRRTGKAPI